MIPAAEVWGDPISHSLSPRLHPAAYRALGWDWSYRARQVTQDTFAEELAARDEAIIGLSLTMPLKRLAAGVSATRDDGVTLTGAANTLRFSAGGPQAFNTDIDGIVRALDEVSAPHGESARILGAGATATSALVALARRGVTQVDVVARRPESARELAPLAARLGITLTVSPFDGDHENQELTISTLPRGAEIDAETLTRLAERGGTLYDVGYGDAGAPLRQLWQTHGLAHDGLTMLLHQAVLQVRIFGFGDPEHALPDEPAVIERMRAALMGE